MAIHTLAVVKQTERRTGEWTVIVLRSMFYQYYTCVEKNMLMSQILPQWYLSMIKHYRTTQGMI